MGEAARELGNNWVMEERKQSDTEAPIILSYASRDTRWQRGWKVALAVAVCSALAVLAWFILAPSSPVSRGLPLRSVCASNLKNIANGLIIYAHEHEGEYPDTLGLLITEGDFAPKSLQCPSLELAEPHYIYLPDADWDSEPPAPVAFDRLANHDGHGANVLFTDAHVEWVTPDRYKKLLAPYVDLEE
jgi:prepilin-type processing-associated H-X9-DG protein